MYYRKRGKPLHMFSSGTFWSSLTYVSLSPDLTTWQGNAYCLVQSAVSPCSTERSRLMTIISLLPQSADPGMGAIPVLSVWAYGLSLVSRLASGGCAWRGGFTAPPLQPG